MIENIKGKTTLDIFNGDKSKAARLVPTEIHDRAKDLLDVINAMVSLDDLKTPPSLRLHKMKVDLKDFWSVSINSQWRIIFRWNGKNATDVEITDYH